MPFSFGLGLNSLNGCSQPEDSGKQQATFQEWYGDCWYLEERNVAKYVRVCSYLTENKPVLDLLDRF